MVIALMIGWKWILRIPLLFFWAVAITANLTGNGFLTQLANEHVTTTITLVFLSLYFLAYPVFEPFFPKIKTIGGESMERSTKILVALLLAAVAITVVALVAPGAVQSAVEGTVVAPLVAGFTGLVQTIDAQRASFMLAGGLIGGLVLALLIKRLDVPKKIRMIRGTPKAVTPYIGAPTYTPPTTIAPTPVPVVAPAPVAPAPVAVAPPKPEETAA